MDWLAANYDAVIRWGTLVLAWFTAGLAMGAAWRWRRLFHRAVDRSLDLVEIVEALERSQDPGRDVHERLAAALEPGLIRHGDSKMPAALERRTLAMALAQSMIETAMRANLEIVARDGD